MRECLIWWRNLDNSEKETLKSEHEIKVVSFDFIKQTYTIKINETLNKKEE